MDHFPAIEVKNASEEIMDKISGILTDNKIEFSTNASNTEIQIKGKDKKEISELIETLDIKKIILNLIIEVCKVKNTVYIRKKNT